LLEAQAQMCGPYKRKFHGPIFLPQQCLIACVTSALLLTARDLLKRKPKAIEANGILASFGYCSNTTSGL